MPIVVVEGLEILVSPEEQYIQVYDIEAKDAEKLWERVKQDYPGFVVDFCFNNTVAPIHFLKEVQAEVLDDCIETRLIKKDMVELQVEKAPALREEDFEIFADFHDKRNPEMAWSSEKLKNDLANWRIFAQSLRGEIAGYSLMRTDGALYWDIYGVEADALEDKVALIAAAVKCAFETNPEAEVVFMVDRENYLELGAALHLGFRRAGYYISYRCKA